MLQFHSRDLKYTDTTTQAELFAPPSKEEIDRISARCRADRARTAAANATVDEVDSDNEELPQPSGMYRYIFPFDYETS